MTHKGTFFSPSCLLVLGLASLLVLWTINDGELGGIPDTYAHTMIGVFFADFIREGAFLNPLQKIMDYVWNYYAHYNNISLLHWPHLFHLVEGLFFLTFGISDTVARLVTYFFFLFGLTYFYRLLRLMFDDWTAFLASLLLITSPIILFMARTVSLEIPSVSLSLVATYYFYAYVREARLPDAILAAIFTGLALLTKQTSVYLLGFFGLFSLYKCVQDKRVFFAWGHLMIFVVIVGLLTAPYYIVSFLYHSDVIFKDSYKGYQHYLSLHTYLYYFATLPKQLTWTTIALLVGSLLSLLTPLGRPVREQEVFLLLWAASCYLLFTALGSKEPRYIIYWVPALCALAALPVRRLAAQLSSRTAQRSLALVMVALFSAATLTEAAVTPRPRVSGNEEVSRFLLSRIPPERKEIVFFDGDFSAYGALVLALRQADPDRRLYLFRSTKFLYAIAIFPHYALWEIRTKEEEIKEFFRTYGIRYICIHFLPVPDWEKLPALSTLRTMMLTDPDFALVKKFPMVFHIDNGGDLARHQGELLLYEYRKATPVPLDLDLELPMPSIGKTITIRLR